MQKIQIQQGKKRDIDLANKILLGFAILLFLFALTFSGSIVLNSFIDGTTVKNMTFTGNENLTTNISIFKTANINSSFSNVSGYNVSCYQEYSNVSSPCGGVSTGSYTPINVSDGLPTAIIMNYMIQPDFSIGNITDGNWDTFRYIDNGYRRGMIINYTKPNGAYAAIWELKTKGDESVKNITIPSGCWDAYPDRLALAVHGYTGSMEDVAARCDNSTNWIKAGASLTIGNGGDGFYEEAIIWLIEINNVTLSINNTNIWNFTGIFNQSNNKTNDFSSILNTALNGGKCDCLGCSLIGNNCTINITGHSDTAGILQLSDLLINYTTRPVVEFISPSNNTFASTTKEFKCNITDIIGLSNVTLYIWNDTGLINNTISNTILETNNISSLNYTFTSSTNFTWNCLATNNQSYSSFADYNYTITSDITNPVITNNAPSNNSYLNYKNNVDFNCTVEGNNLDSLFLYSNFNGSYSLNQTIIGITSGVLNNFQNNLTEGSYLWSCASNQTTGSTITFSQAGNSTLTIDTIKPYVNITSIQTTAGSQTFKFNFTVQDTNIDSCKYSVFNSSGGIDGLNNNVSLTCGANDTSVTVSSYATFNLTVYAIDLANNENSTTQSFTVSQSSPSGGGGGGGGSSSKIPVIALTNVSGNYNYSLLDREIVYSVFYNTCLKKSSDGNDCQFNQLELAMIESEVNTKSVKITKSDLFKFYNIYLKKTLTQGFETQSIINQYGLISATLGSLISLQILPPNVDAPFLINVPDGGAYTITRTLTSNKPLKSCDVIVTDGDLNCTVVNTRIIVTYKLKSTDFTSKIFSSRINVVTEAPSDQTESKQVTLTFRVYNLGHEVFAGVSLLVFIISIGVLTLGGTGLFLYRMQNRKVFKLNKVFNIIQK